MWRIGLLALAACHGGDNGFTGQVGEEGTTFPLWGGGFRLVTGPEALAGSLGTRYPIADQSCGESVTAPGDVDGDGIPDVGVECSDHVQVLGGAALGDPPFARLDLPTGDEAAVPVGDVDGDGLGDLAFARGSQTHDGTPLTWGLVVPGASLRGEVRALDVAWSLLGDATSNPGSEAFAAGDLDGDGLADVATHTSRSEWPDGVGPLDDGHVQVFAGSTIAALPRGGSTDEVLFEVTLPEDLGLVQAALGLGDVDGDGREDLGVVPTPWDGQRTDGGVHPASVYVVSGAAPQASLADAPHVDALPSARWGMVRPTRLGDLDGDGRSEVAAYFTRAAEPEDAYALAVVPGSAVGASGPTSADPYLLAEDAVNEAVPCDLDGDGLPELVTRIGIFAGTDLLIPDAAPVADPVDVPYRGVACAGDLDGDGTEDLAVAMPPSSFDPT